MSHFYRNNDTVCHETGLGKPFRLPGCGGDGNLPTSCMWSINICGTGTWILRAWSHHKKPSFLSFAGMANGFLNSARQFIGETNELGAKIFLQYFHMVGLWNPIPYFEVQATHGRYIVVQTLDPWWWYNLWWKLWSFLMSVKNAQNRKHLLSPPILANTISELGLWVDHETLGKSDRWCIRILSLITRWCVI